MIFAIILLIILVMLPWILLLLWLFLARILGSCREVLSESYI
ncbi:hypothetical protein UF75_3103 [Desulfosporosinus sp. I2]|nr:hypothetical protein UF75_3103 [Desulfosporosinus sp. I2]